MKIIAAVIRVLSWAVYMVIGVSLLLAAPMVFSYRPVVVLSGSMEPVYPVGSVIYYKSATFDEIQVDDVITFSIGDGALATHRVIEKHEADRSFSTKGDNNPSADSNPVEYSRVEGKATKFAIPYAGYFTNTMRQPQVIGILGGILLLSIFISPDKAKSKKSIEHQENS